MNIQEKNIYKNKVKGCLGGGSLPWGIGLVILGTAVAISLITEDGDWGAAVLALVMMVLPGALLTRKAYKAMKESNLENKIFAYIKAKKRITIIELSQKINVSEEIVTDQVIKMIAKGMIDGHINDTNEIVLNETERTLAEETEEQEITVVKCNACGATNKVKVGSPTECEYCGTILNAMK